MGLDFTFMATSEASDTRIPKLRGPYVVYLRYSERRYSRLKIEPQRHAIKALLSPGRAHLIGEFTEFETAATRARPELERAIALCKDYRATLVFGKLGRMHGRLDVLVSLFDQAIKFRAADFPHLDNSGLYRLRWDNERSALKKGEAIKEALRKAKRQGTALGGKRERSEGLRLGAAASAKARSRMANSRSRWIMSEIEALQQIGITSLTGVALHLNHVGIKAPRGGTWSAAQVRRIIRKHDSRQRMPSLTFRCNDKPS